MKLLQDRLLSDCDMMYCNYVDTNSV